MVKKANASTKPKSITIYFKSPYMGDQEPIIYKLEKDGKLPKKNKSPLDKLQIPSSDDDNPVDSTIMPTPEAFVCDSFSDFDFPNSISTDFDFPNSISSNFKNPNSPEFSSEILEGPNYFNF